jgi:hypothetical protein
LCSCADSVDDAKAALSKTHVAAPVKVLMDEKSVTFAGRSTFGIGEKIDTGMLTGRAVKSLDYSPGRARCPEVIGCIYPVNYERTDLIAPEGLESAILCKLLIRCNLATCWKLSC